MAPERRTKNHSAPSEIAPFTTRTAVKRKVRATGNISIVVEHYYAPAPVKPPLASPSRIDEEPEANSRTRT